MTTKNTTAKAPKEGKARVFTFLLYPDSAPENFVELLTDKQDYAVAISPLHDEDLVENPESVPKEYLEEYNGFKKPHYHGIIVANNSTTPSAVRKRLQRAFGKNEAVGMVQICHNIKGAYEYLTHESVDAKRKKKHVYPSADIKLINGFDISRLVTVSADERKEQMRILTDLIYSHVLCNTTELRMFIDANPNCGIDWPTAHELTMQYTSQCRLYFDGAFQQRQREEYLEKPNNAEPETDMIERLNYITLMVNRMVNQHDTQ